MSHPAAHRVRGRGSIQFISDNFWNEHLSVKRSRQIRLTD